MIMLPRCVNLNYAMLLSAWCLLNAGCCQWVDKQPIPPTRKLAGWGEFKRNDLVRYGEFFLSEGQSTSNGVIEIKVVKISPDKCSLFSEPGFRMARIQFVRIVDRNLLLEDDFRVGNAVVMFGENVERKWSMIGISEINTKDKWIEFDLR